MTEDKVIQLGRIIAPYGSSFRTFASCAHLLRVLGISFEVKNAVLVRFYPSNPSSFSLAGWPWFDRLDNFLPSRL